MAAVKREMPPLHAAGALTDTADVAESNGKRIAICNSVSHANISCCTTTASSSSTTSTTSTTNSPPANLTNNTISAAADSSDNKPSTPRPTQIITNDQHQQTKTSSILSYHTYPAQHMRSGSIPASTLASTTSTCSVTSDMYATAGIYTISGQHDMSQQLQHVVAYPSYLSSYEQYYQQQLSFQTPSNIPSSALDYGNTSLMYGVPSSIDVKTPGNRYSSYVPTAILTPNSSSCNNDIVESSPKSTGKVGVENSLPLSNSTATVSTTTSISPLVGSSTSPTSTSSNHMQLVNLSSPGNKQQCKKCSIICINKSELQEHIANIHGSSPYKNSGYSGSSYIKEESLSSSGNQQQNGNSNLSDILDLDSHKMVYPDMQTITHRTHQAIIDPAGSNDTIHSMQQRTLPSWEEQIPTQMHHEGMSPYMSSDMNGTKLHSNQSNFYSPKHSQYHIPSGNSGIKQEYKVSIKSEYDSQTYIDKTFDSSSDGNDGNICQQQPMLPVSSSPADFPTTTTEPQDQQQYRRFETPTSSSVMPPNSITAKAATWKSNEARRPKTYNCTACNKWFTSSGHLKRHYNTTLHKNAVKSSGQPDPASLPISAHHHPSRDPNSKHSRRGGNVSTATVAVVQQQQPEISIQNPQVPISPPNYVSGVRGPISQYSTSPTPTQLNATNELKYTQQNGFNLQHQYLHHSQAETAVSSHHTSENSPGITNQIIPNDHPNGLAGPSLQTSQTSSSQARGLLNTTTTFITKIESTEDKNWSNPNLRSPMDIEMKMLHQQPQVEGKPVKRNHQQHQYQLEETVMEDLTPSHSPQRHNQISLELNRQYHNTLSNMHKMQTRSPLTFSHQQFQEQLQHQHQLQQMGFNTISQRTQPQPLQQVHTQTQQAVSIMDHQYNIIPLGINTQPSHNINMQLLQRPSRIITSTPTTLNMDNTRTTTRSQHQQPADRMSPPMHSMLFNNTNMQSALDTISTAMSPPQQPHITTIIQQQLQLSHTINTIPSYQQLPQEVSGPVAPLEHTMTYHTIIGSNSNPSTPELLQFSTIDSIGNLQSQQMYTSDGQILQFIPAAQIMGQHVYALPTRAADAETYSPTSPCSTEKSQKEAELPAAPTAKYESLQVQESKTECVKPISIPYSPTISSSTITTSDDCMISKNYKSNKFNDANNKSWEIKNCSSSRKTKHCSGIKSSCVKNSRRTDTVSFESPSTNSFPTGCIKCLECNKEFTKVCYLTQHNKSFHSGEYPYRCQKCGKRFQLEEVYTAHLGRHKALDKPHKCDLCPKQFHHKTDLRRHIEAIHTGMKQHICDICEKSFCRKDHLRKHLETHNRARILSKKEKIQTINSSSNIEVKKKIKSSVLTMNNVRQPKTLHKQKNQQTQSIYNDQLNLQLQKQNHSDVIDNKKLLVVIKSEPYEDDRIGVREELSKLPDTDDNYFGDDDSKQEIHQEEQLLIQQIHNGNIRKEFGIVEHGVALY